jgi:hypothetical protein
MLSAMPARPSFVAAAVTLPVSHWGRALEWYQQVLGCEVVGMAATESGGETVELRLGRTRFTLWLDWGDPRVPLADERVRAPALVLLVRSLPAVTKALEARGGKVRTTPTGLAMLEDPFGNQLLLTVKSAQRSSAKHRQAVVAFLESCDAFRAALGEGFRKDGLETFENEKARRAFLRRHGLTAPRFPRRA